MSSKRRALIASATAIAIAVSGTQAVHAEPALGTGVELGTTMDKTIAVDTYVNLADSRLRGIPALKKLRGEMWDLNVPFVDSQVSGSTIREVAANYGLTTKDAYVNAVYSDPHLVAIAVQRAVEESVPRSEMNHDRPFNSQCSPGCQGTYSATFNGTRAWGENLAWSGSNSGIGSMINQHWGYGELAALKEANGVWNLNNGHLHNQLNPKNKAFGFGYVNAQDPTKAFQYAGATAISAYETTKRTDSLEDKEQYLTFYRTAYDWETPKEHVYEVVAGKQLDYKHTAALWGGTSSTWTAPADGVGKTYSATFTGTFPNGTATQETIKVLVKAPLNEEVGLKYPSNSTVTEGQTISIPVAEGITVPAGTTFTPKIDGVTVDQATGTLTLTADRVTEDSSRDFSVDVKYSDGSTATVTVPLTVLNSQADKYPFKAPAESYEVLEEKELRVDLTEALTNVKKVKPSVGRMEGNTWVYKAISVDRHMQVSPEFTLTYEDGSTGTGGLTVYVKNKQSDMYQPQFQDVKPVLEGTESSISLLRPENAPAGVEFTVDSKDVGASFENNKVVFTAPEVEQDTTKTITVTATYSDGSVDAIDLQVPVRNRLSDQYDPKYPDTVNILGGTEKVIDFTDLLSELPEGTTLGLNNLAELDKVEFDPKTNKLTLGSGEVNADKYTGTQMIVRYSDGTEDKFGVVIKVSKKLAERYDPKFHEKTEVFEGQTARITLLDSVVLPEGTQITADNGAKVDGHTITWLAPVVDEDSFSQINVKLTYPNGSVETQTISVMVKNSLAEENEPDTSKVVSPSVNEGTAATVDLTSVIESLPEGARLVPREGVIVNGVLTVDTENVDATETKVVPVDVIYTDGSKDSFTVSIEVKNSGTAAFVPRYESNASVDENSTKTFSPNKLPAGTTVRLVNSVPGVSVDPNTGDVRVTTGELNGDSVATIKLRFTFDDDSYLDHEFTVLLKDSSYKPLFPIDEEKPSMPPAPTTEEKPAPEEKPSTPSVPTTEEKPSTPAAPTTDNRPAPEETPSAPSTKPAEEENPVIPDEPIAEEGSSVEKILGIILAVLAVLGALAGAISDGLRRL